MHSEEILERARPTFAADITCVRPRAEVAGSPPLGTIPAPSPFSCALLQITNTTHKGARISVPALTTTGELHIHDYIRHATAAVAATLFGGLTVLCPRGATALRRASDLLSSRISLQQARRQEVCGVVQEDRAQG